MKKALILLMGLAVVFAIAACGNKENTSTTTTTTPTAAVTTATPAASTAATTTPAATKQAAAGGQQVTLKTTNFSFDKTEYRVKKGEPVTITLDNSQGIHGAAIKEFGINLNNENKTVTFTPDKAGSFPINCSVMCGSGHANMKTTLIVE
ncbi:cupredoxin domain-containing protein [Paenibacillus roseipurpureus]|uniref:Cupredoxin domain-containing protein n=1 Tax=Paenibacillus roseopurpureus TaxID=2918901 RepID=A0AA96RHU1_9BACL|nr:cupredoxin domain-containing protein [Paenibacillus sp. MBLB1832]WNR43608.1 cupredoxin domain-containing protein [Paenibacillus sp. MBLB1832]